LSKCGNKPELVISLRKAYCFPVLLYGSEFMNLNISQTNSLDSTVERLFYELFNSNDSQVIKHCQFYMFCLPTSYAVDLRAAKFYANLRSSDNFLLRNLFVKFCSGSLKVLSCLYHLQNCNPNSFAWRMWTHFENEVHDEIV
jgi:hypothetical protein